MPKRAKEQYDNDDGFVEDAPRSKKARAGANESKKASISTDMKVDDEGNEYWELSRVRRVGISEFKGTTMVNIREFYDKDGKSLPGRKGISLSMDQYNALIGVMPQLEGALKKNGMDVSRPQYDEPPAVEAAKKEESMDEDGGEKEDDEVKDEKPTKSKLDRFKHKANHEATSDEDEA